MKPYMYRQLACNYQLRVSMLGASSAPSEGPGQLAGLLRSGASKTPPIRKRHPLLVDTKGRGILVP